MSKTKQKRFVASFLLLLLCAVPVLADEHIDISTGSETVNGASNVVYSGQGGAIAIYGATGENANGTNKGVSIGENATFSGNKTNGSGGAIYVTNWNGTDSVLNIEGGTKFLDNKAAVGGGAIENTASVVLDTTAGDITFSNNKVNETLNDINTTGTIDMTGDTNSIILNTITGSADAVISKTGANTLVLNDVNSGYLGEFKQSAGATDVNSEFFGGTSTISSLALKDGSSVVSGSTIGISGASEVTTAGNVSVEEPD